MAARFYAGASIKATHTIAQANKVAAPKGSKSMTDMPGFIKTRADASDGGLKGGKGPGPHRPGPIGKPAKPGGLHYTGSYADNGKFRGSSDHSYRATSTAPAGKVVSNKGLPANRGKTEVERSQRGKPKSGFKQSTVKTRSFAPGGVGAGKMESLRGRAKTSYER